MAALTLSGTLPGPRENPDAPAACGQRGASEETPTPDVLRIAVALAVPVGGFVGFKIESGRWRTARRRNAATIDQLQQRLDAAQSLEGKTWLATPQLRTLVRADTPTVGAEAQWLRGDFAIRRVNPRLVRAYF